MTAKNGCTVYHEDFRDVASGWPNKRGYHYKPGTYEIINAKPRSEPNYAFTHDPFDYERSAWGTQLASGDVPRSGRVLIEGLLVANGPLFGDLDASLTVEWKSGKPGKETEYADLTLSPELAAAKEVRAAPGLVFRLDDRGYYAVLLSRHARNSHVLAFKLVKKFHFEPMARDLTPWRDLPLSEQILHKQETISVQCRGPIITLVFQGAAVARYEDADFKEGIVGMILFGEGHAVFRDLLVEEVHGAGLELPLSHGPGAH
jgi:hypothetical protein